MESPTDAEDWILSVDFRLIGFDEHKRKSNHDNVPLCLHPTSLVQLLQFWVPRTQEFEEAVLSGLRLPFLFQEFDVKAERLSLAIINRLGRFEGSEEIPEDTLTKVVMNENLRSRIDTGQPEQQEIQLVRDALVEELRLQAEEEKRKVKELIAEVKGKSDALAKSSENEKAKDVEIKELEEKLEKEKTKSQEADARLLLLTEKQSKIKLSFIYLVLLLVIVLISVTAAWKVDHFLPGLRKFIGTVPAYLVSGLSVFIIAHLVFELIVSRNERVNKLWPLQQMRRFRKWLWMIAIAFVIGVMASLFVDSFHKKREMVEPDKPSSELVNPNQLNTEVEGIGNP